MDSNVTNTPSSESPLHLIKSEPVPEIPVPAQGQPLEEEQWLKLNQIKEQV